MGADMYIMSIHKRQQRKYKPRFDYWVRKRDEYARGGDKPNEERAQVKVREYYDKMYGLGVPASPELMSEIKEGITDALNEILDSVLRSTVADLIWLDLFEESNDGEARKYAEVKKKYCPIVPHVLAISKHGDK